MAIQVIKASGSTAPYSEDKLRLSLSKSGARPEVVDEVVNEVKNRLHDGITTKRIHQIAFKLLKKYKTASAGRYKLKNAIMELGPSGYPFERYIGEILSYEGYTTKLDQIVSGNCVNHEVDIVAEKENEIFFVECKYHNLRGLSCDVKVPLYIYARFLDIQKKQLDHSKIYNEMIATNTRFSDDALKYGLCIGMNLLSWDFPKQKSLREIIDKSGLYPITCLTNLTLKEKQYLLDRKIMLCKTILKDISVLTSIGITGARNQAIINECTLLCNSATEKV